MKKIGSYTGFPCYECDYNEYVKAYKTKQDNGKCIYIIDGTMVRNSVIVGYYDGKVVVDKYDNVPYLTIHEPKQKVAKTADPKTTEDIVYSDYTKVVDDFFARLNDPVI